MRRAARVDENHSRLLNFARSIVGTSVFDTSRLGQGFPDAVMARRGCTVLLEIKNPAMPPSKRRLTEAEQRFHDSWQGWLEIVETEDDILRIVQQIDELNRE